MTSFHDFSDERYAMERSSQLARELDLRRPICRTVAYSERGYSSSGMAKGMDTTESTIDAYMEIAIAKYGFEIYETHICDGDDLPVYEAVGPDYVGSRSHGETEQWVDLVFTHEKKLPAEWVHQVKEKALAHNVQIDG